MKIRWNCDRNSWHGKISKTLMNKNTHPVVKWTHTHLTCLMPHLTKIDHFINEPTQQHQNNENIRTMFSFFKKKTTKTKKIQKIPAR